MLEGPGLAQRAAVRSLQGHVGNLLHTAAATSHSATGLSEEPAAPDMGSQRQVGADEVSSPRSHSAAAARLAETGARASARGSARLLFKRETTCW